jgi:acetyl-CoA hydrolase
LRPPLPFHIFYLPLMNFFNVKITIKVSLSVPGFQRFYKNWDHYAPKIIIRPQFISNHPENIRRLGVIAMNTPIEIDIYGHVNSSHVMGSRVINGIGGSGDFLRNSFLSITHTPSIRPTPSDPTGISCFVPFCSHIDHTEHDVLIYVSEQGLADCRRLDPRARARAIITNCSHPDYKEQLLSYLEMAESECERTGSMHQPHMLRKAFLMHQNFLEKGTMKLSTWN